MCSLREPLLYKWILLRNFMNMLAELLSDPLGRLTVTQRDIGRDVGTVVHMRRILPDLAGCEFDGEEHELVQRKQRDIRFPASQGTPTKAPTPLMGYLRDGNPLWDIPSRMCGGFVWPPVTRSGDADVLIDPPHVMRSVLID